MEDFPSSEKEHKVETPKIKEGVDFVFEQNPELAQIGTKEQYSEYLDNVFPDSKLRDIVYHGTSKDNMQKILEDGFDFSKAGNNLGFIAEMMSFVKTKNEAWFGESVVSALVDLKGKGLTDDGFISNDLLNKIKDDYIYKYHHSVAIYGVQGVYELNDYINNRCKNTKLSEASDVVKFIDFMIDNGQKERLFYDILKANDVTGSMRNESIVDILDTSSIQVLGSSKDLENFKKFIENYTD